MERDAVAGWGSSWLSALCFDALAQSFILQVQCEGLCIESCHLGAGMHRGHRQLPLTSSIQGTRAPKW
jgi:hypothetical protein